MRERAILHSDANCFFASVEIVLNPSLRGKPMAVCGSQKDRHGIVLAKSEEAKRAGVKTGQAIWQAQQVCPDIIVVQPQYDYYMKFSKLLQGIYRRYTDLIEPFGLDECWLDITATGRDAMEIAEEIRCAVKDELGFTVSIGVSFNKVFAKLGSDYKKPDAITQITRENFKDVVWPLPCSDLLYCGRATTAKLSHVCVETIGQLAALPVEFMKKRFGKNGVMLWAFANGLDDSRVAHQEYSREAKSVGHGITCVADLDDLNEAKMVIYALSQDIGTKLRYMHLRATGINVRIRDNELHFYMFQSKLETPTYDEAVIAKTAYELLKANLTTQVVRSITVTAYGLESSNIPLQLMFFDDPHHLEVREQINKSIDLIREKYGKKSIIPACVLGEKKIPRGSDHETRMPGMMYV